MTNEQKIFYENIIKLFKENRGILHKLTLFQKLDEELNEIERTSFLQKFVNEYVFAIYANDIFTLTEKGHNFISFNDYEKQLQVKNEKENIDFQISKTNLLLNKWLLKTKWLPHFIAVISFLFAVYVYFDSKNDSKKLEERIENLESTISDSADF